MANVYRAKIASMEPNANGSIYADCWIELRTGTNPDFTWIPASNGHFTLVLSSEEIMGALNDPANNTNVLKRQAIRNIIKEKALERGIDKSDEAFLEINKLFTFPDDIVIRQ